MKLLAIGSARLAYSLPIFIGFLFLFAQPVYAVGNSAAQLRALLAKSWQQNLRYDPVTASTDGFHAYDALWPAPSLAAEHLRLAQIEANLLALKRIPTAQLDPSEQLNDQLFAYRLADQAEALKFPDHALLLMNQLWGPQTLGSLPRQLRFTTQADYVHWLRRLQGLGAYLDAFTRRQRAALAAGIMQPAVVMKRVPGEIAGQIVGQPDDSPFYIPFKHMPDTIPVAEQNKLRRQARQTILTVVNPAYRRFKRFILKDYLPRARSAVGVSSLPKGRTYYSYLVRHFTTTDMTPAQVHALGLRQVAGIRRQMRNLFRKIDYRGSYRSFLQHLRTDPKFYYSQPQALLEAYRAAAKRVDPYLVQIAGTWLLPRVPYGVRPIPKALAPNTYPAYSVPPSGDGMVAGYVGVNLYKPASRPKYDIQVLMCHEGRPGHQLQIPVAMQRVHLPAFRRFAYYNAYGEGWALYAERLCNELGLYDNPYSKFGYLNYQMWRAVRLVVDTGLHADGWSRARAIRYMQDNTALSNENIRNEVDRYIAWPGQALSYMVGELEILKLRQQAKTRLGAKYSLRDFNDVVLGQGSLPMAVLAKLVQRWIGRTRSGLPADQLPYAQRPRSLGE